MNQGELFTAFLIDLQRIFRTEVVPKDLYYSQVLAIIIITEWSDYSKIDWVEIENVMRKPSWVFDSRSVIDPKDFVNSSLNIWRVGDGSIL